MRILVAGPPASGKSTLAKQLAAVHDAAVIDFDDIAAEMGSDSHHDHPDDVRVAVREEIERRIDALDGPAVVIRSAPTKAERGALAARIGADHVVLLSLEADEAKRRAAADERPDWTADAIDRWWQRYEPDDDAPAMGANPKGPAAMADEAPTSPATGDSSPTPPPPPPPPPKADADMGDAGTKALKEERAARREAERQLKELAPLAARAKELEDASKSEAEKLTERLTAAEQRAVAAETNALRLEIAGEKGLTPTQAKRLIGSTRKELEADADDLLATFAPAAPPAPKPGSRPKENLKTVPVAANGAVDKTDMNEWMRQQATRKST